MFQFILQIKRKSLWQEYRLLFSVLLIFASVFFIFLTVHFTHSTLTDRKQSKNNSFSAGTWEEETFVFQAEDILTLEQKVIVEEKILEDIEDSGKEIVAPEIGTTTKTFDITLKGELNVPYGYSTEIFHLIKSIKLKGETDALSNFTDLEINLADIEIEKDGEIDILVADLNINEDLTPASAKGDDILLSIIVREDPKEEISAKDTSQ